MFSGCSSTNRKDSFSKNSSSRAKYRSGNDSYSGSGGGRKLKKHRDSYSKSSFKFSLKFWKKWKRSKDSYGVSRKRRRPKRRKPQMGIKNN